MDQRGTFCVVLNKPRNASEKKKDIRKYLAEMIMGFFFSKLHSVTVALCHTVETNIQLLTTQMYSNTQLTCNVSCRLLRQTATKKDFL